MNGGTPCRVCGRPVAGSAWSCPHCGSQAATRGMIWAKGLLIGFQLALLAWLFVSCTS